VQVEFPLFSNYVFVHIARPERIRVLQVPGVVSFVGTARGPQPISASEIELLRDRIHEFRNLEPCPYLNAGDRVRILIGPLSGLEGILVRKKNNLRLILTVEAIRKSFSIEVDADSVESVITTAVTFGRRSQK
jgi:transcription antitermination factor NusG